MTRPSTLRNEAQACVSAECEEPDRMADESSEEHVAVVVHPEEHPGCQKNDRDCSQDRSVQRSLNEVKSYSHQEGRSELRAIHCTPQSLLRERRGPAIISAEQHCTH